MSNAAGRSNEVRAGKCSWDLATWVVDGLDKNSCGGTMGGGRLLELIQWDQGKGGKRKWRMKVYTPH